MMLLRNQTDRPRPGAPPQLQRPRIKSSNPKYHDSHHFDISSHNLQGKSELIENYYTILLRNKGRNGIFLLQDIGADAARLLGMLDALHEHAVYYFINQSPTNSCRSVAILVGKDWRVLHNFSNQTGSAIGVLLFSHEYLLACFSTYLPPGLDNLSNKVFFNEASVTRHSEPLLQEARDTYKTLCSWISSLSSTVYWIVGGDFNETRSKLDRVKEGKIKTSRCRVGRLIENFMSDVEGVDVWRTLYPNISNGFTRTHYSGSKSRLDYFIMKFNWFYGSAKDFYMYISHNKDIQSDHARISISFPSFKFVSIPLAWSVKRPRLPENKTEVQEIIHNFESECRDRPCEDWKEENIAWFTSNGKALLIHVVGVEEQLLGNPVQLSYRLDVRSIFL